jgi:hypothetical protein
VKDETLNDMEKDVAKHVSRGRRPLITAARVEALKAQISVSMTEAQEISGYGRASLIKLYEGGEIAGALIGDGKVQRYRLDPRSIVAYQRRLENTEKHERRADIDSVCKALGVSPVRLHEALADLLGKVERELYDSP